MTTVKRLPGLVIGLAMIACIGTLHAQEQKRLALVIGNSTYASAPLRNPENDARAMVAKLEHLNFKVISVINGTYRQMINAENDFADQLNRYDVGLFYYSGHGVQFDGSNYLVPVDAKIQRSIDIQFDTLNAQRVIADMGAAGTRVNIIILDACRNNPFNNQFRSLQRGLSVVQAPAGSLVVYSTAPDQVAADGDGKNSPFTAALLKNISTPGEDVQLMLTHVFREVHDATDGKQVPWSNSSLTSPFYFVPEAASVAEAPKASTTSSSTARLDSSSLGLAAGNSGREDIASVQTTATSYEKGKLTINVQAIPKVHGYVRVQVTGPTSESNVQASTYVTSRFFDTPLVLTLAPGLYQVQLGFGEDTNPPYTKETSVIPGGNSSLNVPLDYSVKFKAEQAQLQVSSIQSKRDDWSGRLKVMEQERSSRGLWGGILSGVGAASALASGIFLLAAASNYNYYSAATTSTDASKYRSLVVSDRSWFYGTAIGGVVAILVGFLVLSERPSTTRASSAIQMLDAQLAAIRANSKVGE